MDEFARRTSKFLLGAFLLVAGISGLIALTIVGGVKGEFGAIVAALLLSHAGALIVGLSWKEFREYIQ